MPRTDTILLASSAPLEPTLERLEEAGRIMRSIPAIAKDIETWFDGADARSLLIRHLLLGVEGLRTFLERDGAGAIQTDSNLRLEFDAPLRLFDRSVTVLAVQRSILAAVRAPEIARVWERSGSGTDQLPALRSLIDFLADSREWGTARELLDLGLRIAPDDPHLVAVRFMSSLPADDAAWDEKFSRVLVLSAEEAARVGVWLHLEGHHERAVRAWRKLLDVHPQAATLWMNLSLSLDAKGEKDESRVAREKSRSLDPFAAVAPPEKTTP